MLLRFWRLRYMHETITLIRKSFIGEKTESQIDLNRGLTDQANDEEDSAYSGENHHALDEGRAGVKDAVVAEGKQILIVLNLHETNLL